MCEGHGKSILIIYDIYVALVVYQEVIILEESN